MNPADYAFHKISINKYKGLTFEETAKNIIENDKKYINILTKNLNTSKTPPDKKQEIENFLNYFFNHFEPNYNKSTNIPKETIKDTQPINLWFAPINHINFDKPINNIIHISDVHIRLYNRYKEYQDVFEKLYKIIEQEILINPNQIIIITGDLLHSKNNLSPECILTTQNFLIKLSSFTTTLLIAGNHDALLNNSQREDSITAIMDKINIPNFYYLKYSAIYYISNLAIAVNSIIDNKWIFANTFLPPKNISHKIALYHGPVGICETDVGYRLKGEKLIEDFNGYDYALLGDIHKFQFLDPEKNRIAYASSLIAQNFGEWNSPHGFLQWDIINKHHKYIPIENECGFLIFNLNENQIFIENQPISTNNIQEYLQKSSMNIKLNIQNCSTEFISKINYLIKQSCQDVKIIHNYLGTKTKETQPELIIDSNSLLTQYIQKNHQDISQEDIQFILNKYQELAQDIEINNEQNLSRWELIDIEFSNLFGYGPDNYIDFSRFSSDNPIGIIAPNSHGKSSLIDIILLTLFTKFSRSRGTGISKDIINVNANTFSSKLRFKIGSEIFIIIKEGKKEQSDKVKITKNEFYKQNNSNITLLTDEDRKKTDKIISELIGTYDDFIFTNVQLQNRSNSFKEMTDKERKEYLYKVLRLNIWNDIAKKILESIKPIKNNLSFLEKSIENKSASEIEEKLEETRIEIEIIQDKIDQQLFEKQINEEMLEEQRSRLIPNLILEKYDEEGIKCKLMELEDEMEDNRREIIILKKRVESFKNEVFHYIPEKTEIISDFNNLKNKNSKKISNLENTLSQLTLTAIIPTKHLWNKISKKEKDPLYLIKINNDKIDIINNSKENYIELDESNKKIDKIKLDIQLLQNDIQKLSNEKIIIQNKLHQIKDENIVINVDVKELKTKLKLKQKEKEVVKSKIDNFKSKLQSEIYETLKLEEPLHNQLLKLKQEENELKSLLKNLENHEYDPKCKFCIKHPIVKQKEEKIIYLKNLQKEINSIEKSITINNPDEVKERFNEIQLKLQEKQTKLSSLETLIIKMELEIEKMANLQEKLDEINSKKEENEINKNNIKNISDKLVILTKELNSNEKNLKYFIENRDELLNNINNNEKLVEELKNEVYILKEIVEIDEKNEIIKKENLKIDNIKEEINLINNDFISSNIYNKYNKLQDELQNEISNKLNIMENENKLQNLEFKGIGIENSIREFMNCKESILFNRNVRTNIDKILLKIVKNDNFIGKFNENLGVLYQKQKNVINELEIFRNQVEELKLKKKEYKLMQILEQSLGKDGLPLMILQNYLIPITESINNIISPFISRIINLHIDNDDLILDSFPDNSGKSVYIHGGMESFILDIAFKITLSNFAKLPKCDILFLDEGISAFDSERLSNIDTLFNFIKKYFTKTILITHIDTVKENIIEKIGIVKENNLSKIICEYSV